MRPHSGHQASFSFQATLAIVLVGVLFMILLAGYAIFAARQIDARVAKEEQTQVGLFLSSRLSTLQTEQQTITAWDDSVLHVSKLDMAWISENIGVFMQDGFGHNAAFVLDAADQPVYAMSNGADAPPNVFSRDSAALLPLVAELRRQVQGEEDRADLGVADFAMVQGSPAMVSVKLIVPYADKVKLPAGAEAVHITVRKIDANFLKAIAERELLDEVAYQPSVSAPVPSGQGQHPIVSASGLKLGSIVWQADHPGTELIKETAPALLSLCALLAGFMAFLVSKLQAMERERTRVQAHTTFLAHHDTLTGLYNRAMFNETLDDALKDKASRGGVVALHYIDLDGFKNINDTLGHPVGDELIRQVALRLTTTVGSEGVVARLGGDEFAVIQPGTSSRAEAAELARLILEAVRAPFELGKDPAVVGASIGVALAEGGSATRTELMRMSDIALYDAKGHGKNRVCLFEPKLDEEVQHKRGIERDLREALEGGKGLRLDYQPLYSADGQSVIGAEALLRWDHPIHGILSPGIFVPIAEERGLIVDLGDFVLREACRTASEVDLPWIAVNVSATQLKEPMFPQRVLELLRENGLTPNRIEIEITEGVLLDETEKVASALRQLRALGISIALDDFGTGYSSLQYLHRYPVDKIKIDRSFVASVADSGQAQALVRAMVDVARAFDMTVVAEGVETKSQLDSLTSIGCDQIQGWLLAKAMRTEELQVLLSATQTAAA